MRRSELIAKKRERTGKGGARQTRFAGSVPGVMYGLGQDNVNVLVNAHDFGELIKHGEHQIIELKMDSDSPLTIIKDMQRDPVTEDVTHIDFLRIDLDKPIQTSVAIHLEGTAPGTKEGGVLEQPLWELAIEAKPTDIPEYIVADISGMVIGDTLHVSDLPIPENIILLTEADEAVVSCVPPATLVVEEEEVEGEELEEGEEGEARAEEGEEESGEKE